MLREPGCRCPTACTHVWAFEARQALRAARVGDRQAGNHGQAWEAIRPVFEAEKPNVFSELFGHLGNHHSIDVMPLKGSVLLLFGSSCVFLFGALCWGVMLSASTRSQLLAYQLGTLTSFLPAFLLSGFIYSIQNMPKAIQLITYLVPARYFIVILKGIFLKGAGVRIFAVELGFLFLYAVIVFVLASRKLRQKIA